MNLEEWRSEIDEIDREIVKLIERRARVVKKIGEIKMTSGLPARDRHREIDVLRNIRTASTGGMSEIAMVRIFSEIIRESRELQRRAIARENGGIEARW